MKKKWSDLKVGQKYIKIRSDFYSPYNGLTVFQNKEYVIFSVFNNIEQKCVLTNDNPHFKFIFGNVAWLNDNFEPVEEEEII